MFLEVNMKRFFRKALPCLLSFLIVFSTLTGHYGANAATQFVDTSGYESLAEIYKDYFKIGAGCEAVGHWGQISANKEIGNPDKEAVLSRIFNSITCGNELKPAYNFSPTSETLFKVDPYGEKMLKWCKENNTHMRFHVLVWHSQVSANFFAKDFKATSNGVPTDSGDAALDEDCLVDRDTLIERLRKYIYGAMEYIYSNGFAETIYTMDVVNEAVDESTDDGLRRSYWYKIIGPEFLYYSFLFAREAEVKYSKEYASLYGLDPNGDLSSIRPKLVYNDYNEWFPKRVEIVKDFITNRAWNKDQQMIKSDVIKPDGDGTMKGDGLIDGIGMQGHLSDNNSIPQYIDALRAYNEIVDEVQVTELDVKCTRSGEQRWYYQAKFYYDFFKALVEEKKNGVNLTSVTIWGLTDDQSWIEGAYPLLFTYNLTAKAAFNAVVMAGKGEEFDLTVAETITELKDTLIDFEPYKDENGVNTSYSAESAGFMPRGTGHIPKLRPVTGINHTENAVLGFSLLCERAEQDATCMINVSKYSGRNITFTAYVKTDDTEVSIGLDTGESKELKKIKSDGNWKAISKNTDIPEKLDSAFIYFETNGKADLYIDDISIIYTKDGEEPAPVISDGDSESDISPEPADSGESTVVSPTPVPVSENDSKASTQSNTTVIIAIVFIIVGSLLICFAIFLLFKNRKKSDK